MYEKLPNLVFGFHGCGKTVFDQVIHGGVFMTPSTNSYDWLGHGIYFWENGYYRALDWAKQHCKNDEPAVIGAVIDLGYCLNLTDYDSSKKLMHGYELLKLRCEASGDALPENKPSAHGHDVYARNLDCAVIEQIHDYLKETEQPTFDSVRGVFVEGGPAYPGAQFMEKTHIQLCVINPNCIKGLFVPRATDGKYVIP